MVAVTMLLELNAFMVMNALEVKMNLYPQTARVVPSRRLIIQSLPRKQLILLKRL